MIRILVQNDDYKVFQDSKQDRIVKLSVFLFFSELSWTTEGLFGRSQDTALILGTWSLPAKDFIIFKKSNEEYCGIRQRDSSSKPGMTGAQFLKTCDKLGCYLTRDYNDNGLRLFIFFLEGIHRFQRGEARKLMLEQLKMYAQKNWGDETFRLHDKLSEQARKLSRWMMQNLTTEHAKMAWEGVVSDANNRLPYENILAPTRNFQ